MIEYKKKYQKRNALKDFIYINAQVWHNDTQELEKARSCRFKINRTMPLISLGLITATVYVTLPVAINEGLIKATVCVTLPVAISCLLN